MDISAIEPPFHDLPHIGRVKLQILSINTVIWISENSSLVPHIFLKSYLNEFAKRPDDTAVDASALTNFQSDEVANVLLNAIKDDEPEEKPDDEEVHNSGAKALKDLMEKRGRAMEERTTLIIQKTLKTMGPLIGTSSVLKSMQATNKHLHSLIHQSGLQAMRKNLRPAYMDQMASLAKTRQNLLKMYQADNSLFAFRKELQHIVGNRSSAVEAIRLASQISNEMRVTHQLAATLPKIERHNVFDIPYLEKNLALPGFEMTARAGLSGMASKAVSSEILSRYSNDNITENNALNATIETIQGLDILDYDDDGALSNLAQSVPDKLGAFKTEHLPLWISFIIMILSALTLYATLVDDGDEIIANEIAVIKSILQESQLEYQRIADRYRHERMLTHRYHLREDPNIEAQSLTVLNTDRIVTVLKTENDWAYVEVIPFGSEPALKGWINRKRLKPF